MKNKKVSKKMKEWAETKKCPSCMRKNALSFYPGDKGMIAVCRWCKQEFTK